MPKLITFVSQKTGLTEPQVVAALQKNFPHTTALLQAIPLSAVTAEIPGLLSFLETNLKVSQADLLSALTTNFPGIATAVTNLPAVTNGWNEVPKVDGLTRFDGKDRSRRVPGVAAYFSDDVIPVLETQHDNYENLVSTSNINFIGWLVLIVGFIVIVYGVLMLILARAEPRRRTAAAKAAAAEPVAA